MSDEKKPKEETKASENAGNVVDANADDKPDKNVIVRISVTMVYEVNRSIIEENEGDDFREELLSHAKQEWKKDIYNIKKEHAKFDNC